MQLRLVWLAILGIAASLPHTPPHDRPAQLSPDDDVQDPPGLSLPQFDAHQIVQHNGAFPSAPATPASRTPSDQAIEVAASSRMAHVTGFPGIFFQINETTQHGGGGNQSGEAQSIQAPGGETGADVLVDRSLIRREAPRTGAENTTSPIARLIKVVTGWAPGASTGEASSGKGQITAIELAGGLAFWSALLLMLAVLGLLAYTALLASLRTARAALLALSGRSPRRPALRERREAPELDSLRELVASLPCCSASDVHHLLPEGQSYDCALPKPLSSQQLVRLQGRVLGPVDCQELLEAPLSRKTCVLYSATVSCQLHDDSITMAFAEHRSNFAVSLLDAPQFLVHVVGADVSLFDMHGGLSTAATILMEAPAHWQDFVARHQTAMLDQCSVMASELEFCERALVVGALVTMAGELWREANGTLALRPLRPMGSSSSKRGESWRTSWECAGLCGEASLAAAAPASSRQQPQLPQQLQRDGGSAAPSVYERVVPISDDPLLQPPRRAPVKVSSVAGEQSDSSACSGG